MQATEAIQPDTLAWDVRAGLAASPKFLSSKYFYDDEGSRLFQEIMKLPEYYLTRAEAEIFDTQHEAILQALDAPFDIIELGAGDGTKTAALLGHFVRRRADFTYAPIDISQEAVNALTAKFAAALPALKIDAKLGDYFRVLESMPPGAGRKKALLFLGSNIGNFPGAQSLDFFRRLRAVMSGGDLLFVGFDLQKDPRVIVPAYDDAQGVTAAFNLNLLRRINRELGGDFVLDNFSHHASYHPVEGAMRSYLLSRRAQTVSIAALNQSFRFAEWEPVFVEISQKYSLAMIETLAQQSGFQVQENFFDSRRYFVDSLWRVA
jgi:dimethylhistidine N-methyltransferase